MSVACYLAHWFSAASALSIVFPCTTHQQRITDVVVTGQTELTEARWEFHHFLFRRIHLVILTVCDCGSTRLSLACPLTSLKASRSSFTPIIPAVSAKSFGAINSTKSSKSTLPPTERQRKSKNRSWILISPHLLYFLWLYFFFCIVCQSSALSKTS